MASTSVDVLVFGDQAVDTYPYLRQLLTRREHTAVLSSFLKQATIALRTDIASLHRSQRQALPSTHDLLEFIEAYRISQGHNSAVGNALLVIAQLAHWIGLAEESPEILSVDKRIVGNGVGLLSAAAVSSFSSLPPFLPLAVEHVRIAFRLGVQVDAVSERISSSEAGQAGWSKVVPGFNEESVEEILADFHRQAATPAPKSAYISCIGPAGVTISGPPETISSLFDTTMLKNSRPTEAESFGPYGASHLYDDIAVRAVLASTDDEAATAIEAARPQATVFSNSAESEYAADSCRSLLEQVVADVLQKTANSNRALSVCASQVKTSKCRVVPIGPCLDAELVVAKLQEAEVENISLFETALGAVQRRGTGNYKSSKIAIVGMSGRFPGGNDIHEFWEMLQKGLDMHKEVPADRFDARAHYDPSGKGRNMSHTPFGNFIENAGLFDPRFFNMSPREATQTDPMQRLAITTAYEALEMAGYVANRTPSTKLERIGTFYGQTSDDWREINEAQDVDTYFITGGVRAFGPGRINYYFKFSGPSFSVDTACSSSMAALQLACTSLWAGDCDTAITGGLNVMTNPDIFSGLSKGQFLSKTGNCQTFDNDADGYCRGDGVGTVILKRLEDAEADNDNILATILATATNHSAEAISITHPHAETQEALYKKVLDQAGVDARDVGYVEMHGTGTQAGDNTEMTSVSNVFAPAERRRKPHQKLYLSSVKANIGHGEAASGVSALIKVLMMLRHSTIPPHAGIKRDINKTFPKDLAARNVHIPMVSTPFPRGDDKRIVYINNFSAAGGNTALLLEDAPKRAIKGADPRSSHVVALSARALSSLKSNLQRLDSYLQAHPDTSLGSLSYTTLARRIHHNYKISFTVSSVDQLRQALSKAADSDTEPTSTAPNVAFTFTGQGSHYASLAADLYKTSLSFRTDLDSYNSIATSLGYPSFLPLIDGSVSDVSTLSPTLVQVGLTSVQIALARLWTLWGVKPSVVIGHSLGEYAALYAAGILSVSDAIYLVGERAKLLEKNCTAGTHAMLACKSSVSGVQHVINATGAEVACINGPSETVLSGTSAVIDSAKEMLETQGLKGTRLNVPFAFHSSQVDAIVEEFARIASGVTFNKPRIPLLSPLFGTVETDVGVNAEYLCRHAREAVNYLGAINAGQEAGLIKSSTVFVEVGPHPVSLGFVKAALGTSQAGGPSLRRNDAAWTAIASTASLLYNKGVEIDWNEYHRDFLYAHELLELPSYAFALKNYWIQYKNNWCLTKGDPVSSPAAVSLPKLSTSSVQNVVQEEYTDGKGLLVAESDIHREDLLPAIAGHEVNGNPFCPSSLYGDICVTVAEYMFRRVWDPNPETPLPGINVRDMEVPQGLVAKPGTEQILKITAKADRGLDRISFSFSTGRTEHAHCIVDFGDRTAWEMEWSRSAYLVDDRIRLLHARAEEGKANVLSSGMAYKLFEALVNYGDTYRGMRRVVFDARNTEATAKVVLQALPEGQKFSLPPYWIDSVGHIGGFCVNANDELDSKSQVYISHGWESMRLSRPLEAGKEYKTYVRMLPGEGKVVVGDVYLFEGETVIGVFGGLKFQCIPRRLFEMMLPNPSGRKVAVPEPAPAAIQTTSKVEKRDNVVKTTKSIIVKQATASVTSQTLDIVAEECGVALSELADGNSFADLGVDSLMQLAISGRMRETLELDISSTLFVDYPTIGALKGYLAAFEQPSAAGAGDPLEDGSSASSSPHSSQFGDDKSSTVSSPNSSPPDKELYSQDKVSRAVEVIASQRGLRVSDLTSALSDISSTSTSTPSQVVGPVTAASTTIVFSPAPQKQAQSIILQGSPKTATQNFFLLPDGGGSAASYVPIPEIAKGTCVFGLNSPYMKTPEEYQCGVPGIAEMFVKEIRRRQPEGPYALGGWSAGGVIAYEVAQQLLKAAQPVSHLILIDAPCPLIIEPLPLTLHQWFNEIGLLGDPTVPMSKKLPSWLLPHFGASINALSTYNARKLMDPAGKAGDMKTVVIWCEDGIVKEEGDPRPEPYPYGHAQFLLERGEDFDWGDGLWDSLLGKGKVRSRRVPGNHFTMMKGANAVRLGDEIRNILCG